MDPRGMFHYILDKTGAVRPCIGIGAAPPVWVSYKSDRIIYNLIAEVTAFFRFRYGICDRGIFRYIGISCLTIILDCCPSPFVGDKRISFTLVNPAQYFRIRIRFAADPKGFGVYPEHQLHVIVGNCSGFLSGGQIFSVYITGYLPDFILYQPFSSDSTLLPAWFFNFPTISASFFGSFLMFKESSTTLTPRF